MVLVTNDIGHKHTVQRNALYLDAVVALGRAIRVDLWPAANELENVIAVQLVGHVAQIVAVVWCRLSRSMCVDDTV